MTTVSLFAVLIRKSRFLKLFFRVYLEAYNYDKVKSIDLGDKINIAELAQLAELQNLKHQFGM